MSALCSGSTLMAGSCKVRATMLATSPAFLIPPLMSSCARVDDSPLGHKRSALPPKADIRRLIRSPPQGTYCRSGSDPHSTLNGPSGRVSGSRRPPPGPAWGCRTYVQGRQFYPRASPVRGGCLHRGRSPSRPSSLGESPPQTDPVLLESSAKTRHLPHDLQQSSPASACKGSNKWRGRTKSPFITHIPARNCTEGQAFRAAGMRPAYSYEPPDREPRPACGRGHYIGFRAPNVKESPNVDFYHRQRLCPGV